MKQRPLGQLRAGINPDVVMMICTAGHVDHGKTSLVKLLTGCNTDRLKQEQKRGLTIELGFAPCFLGGNISIGIVDVPGHEKFIRNMVAGVSGIGMTVLVIAADDGIMPQTIEHFQIMELMGVRHGIVALTKIDLAGEERTKEVAGQIQDFFKGTFLSDAPIFPLSSETGEGFFEFYNELVAKVKGLVAQKRQGVFRMPIERVFVQKGFGVVLTGIPVDGAIEVGATVEIVPGGQRGKMRGMQRFLRDAADGGRGQCLAINIPDLAKNPPVRGQVVSVPGYLRGSVCFHILVKAVSTLDAPLRNAEAIKLHTGTSEEHGKIYLLEQKVLEQGEEGLATIVLANEVAVSAGDRFIIRRASPATTVAGGEVLLVSHEARRPKRKHALAQLGAYQEFFADVDMDSPEGADKKLEYALLTDHKTGATAKTLAFDAMLPLEAATEGLGRLRDSGNVMALGADQYIHLDSYNGCFDLVKQRVLDAAEKRDALSIMLTELRAGLDWPQALWARIQDDLEKQGVAVSAQGSKLVLKKSVSNMSAVDRELMDKIIATYDDTGFKSPRSEELHEMLSANEAKIKKLVDLLCDQGALIRLSKNVLLSAEHYRHAQKMVVSDIEEKGTLDSADFKFRIDSTRKYALAILDYLDTRKVTVRIGNGRKLHPNYKKNML